LLGTTYFQNIHWIEKPKKTDIPKSNQFMNVRERLRLVYQHAGSSPEMGFQSGSEFNFDICSESRK